jgi:hypothetical protein
LAHFLRARHYRLYDARIAEMRRVSARQLPGMAAGDVASAATIAAAIAGILWLAVSHHLSLSSAVAGAAALAMLGQRLAFAGQSAGMLQESAMFIDGCSPASESCWRADRCCSSRTGSPRCAPRTASTC